MRRYRGEAAEECGQDGPNHAVIRRELLLRITLVVGLLIIGRLLIVALVVRRLIELGIALLIVVLRYHDFVDV